MNRRKANILCMLLLLGFLLISCDAILLPTTPKDPQSSYEINTKLQKNDHQISSEVSSAFLKEQQEKEQTNQHTQEQKFKALQKSAQDFDMMDIAQKEFSKQEQKH